MPKLLSLEDLHNSFIRSGMNIHELSSYLRITEDTLQEWSNYFCMLPENSGADLDNYSEETIEKFIKIKKHYDKGKSLSEIKDILSNNPFRPDLKLKANTKSFEKLVNEQDKSKDNPFTKELKLANEKINELIFQRTRFIEESAVEKANLLTQVNFLKGKNQVLLAEKQMLEKQLEEKQNLLKNSAEQENILKNVISISHRRLEEKDGEINSLKDRIKMLEAEISNKASIISDQKSQLSQLLEEKFKKKWWQVWKYLNFFKSSANCA